MYLAKGATGDDVRKLQQRLGITVDGIFGNETEQAVRNYQSSNGLDVDGIVGNQTWSALNSAPEEQTAATGNESTSGYKSTVPAFEPKEYEQSEGVKQAFALIDQHKASMPGEFAWGQQGELDAAVEAWRNREDFSYDAASDPLYQIYREQHANLGNLAMQDTMGQAAALTGGYGNSWAQTVGQQAYNSYMKEAAAKIPELYSLYLQQYNQEGQRMADDISLLRSLRDTAYGEHQDSYGKWLDQLNYLSGEAQSLADREYEDFIYDQNLAYQLHQDAVEADRYQKEWDYQLERDAIDDERYRQEWEHQLAMDESDTQKSIVGGEDDDYYSLAIGQLKSMKVNEPAVSEASYEAYEAYLQDVMNYLNELVADGFITEKEKTSLYNKYVGNQL